MVFLQHFQTHPRRAHSTQSYYKVAKGPTHLANKILPENRLEIHHHHHHHHRLTNTRWWVHFQQKLLRLRTLTHLTPRWDLFRKVGVSQPGVQMKCEMAVSIELHPQGLTWNLQITHLERKMIFQTSMIMFHVNLQGCKRDLHFPAWPFSGSMSNFRGVVTLPKGKGKKRVNLG